MDWGHIAWRALVHFGSAGTVLIGTTLLYRWGMRRLPYWMSVVTPAVYTLAVLGWLEPSHIAQGDPWQKSYWDLAGWIVILGGFIYAQYRLWGKD